MGAVLDVWPQGCWHFPDMFCGPPYTEQARLIDFNIPCWPTSVVSEGRIMLNSIWRHNPILMTSPTCRMSCFRQVPHGVVFARVQGCCVCQMLRHKSSTAFAARCCHEGRSLLVQQCEVCWGQPGTLPCKCKSAWTCSLHPLAATFVPTKVALVNGAPLKGVVRNASTNAAWPR